MKNQLLILYVAASIFLFGLLAACTHNENKHTLSSPNLQNRIEFEVTEGKMYYAVYRADSLLIDKSRLGFHLEGELQLSDSFQILTSEKSSHRETWKPYWGQRSEVLNEYNEMQVFLKQTNSNGLRLNVLFRAYNDGVAFRYVVPNQSFVDSLVVEEELSSFNFLHDYQTWSIPANFDSYEFLYRELPLSELNDANTPLTLRAENDLHLSIHEAHLVNYPEMTLLRKANSTQLAANLAPAANGYKLKSRTPFSTPWRSIQISDGAAGLLLSDLIQNLNPAPESNFDWVKPMKYIGIWWDMHIGYTTWTRGPRHGATTLRAKRYIDFAAQHGIEAVLFEGWNTGWEAWGKEGAFDYVTPYPDFDMEEISRYASEKGVALIGHHETGGDARGYEQMVDTAFAYYKNHGVNAVKTGYAGGIVPQGESHHGQWMVNHYRKIVRKAAAEQIMLNVHEPIKPTGEERTYPNMMTREGARGMEWNAWSTGNPPSHTCILPFTRCLAGPLDYTPGIFDVLLERKKDELLDWNNKPEGTRVHTTLVKQLALMLVLYSPMQMASDLIEHYEKEPALEWFKAVPVSFDETRILNARIGEYVTLARRSQQDWFVAGISNEKARVWEVNLDFLQSGKQYQVIRYLDGDSAHYLTNPLPYTVDTLFLAPGDRTLEVSIAPGGGFAMQITPQ